MKGCILFLLTGFSLMSATAQQVESIHTHLYTDSLKKGTYNYINVDGKMSDGSWKPLTDKELKFTSTYGKFEGNNLILPDNPTVSKVSITATLKENPRLTRNITIWIKQRPDPLLSNDDPDAYRTRRSRR